MERVVCGAFEAAYSASPERDLLVLDVCAVEQLVRSELLTDWFVCTIDDDDDASLILLLLLLIDDDDI